MTDIADRAVPSPMDPCGNEDCDKCDPRPRWKISQHRVQHLTYTRKIKAGSAEEAMQIFEAGTAWPSQYDDDYGAVIQRDEPLTERLPPDEYHLTECCFHDLVTSSPGEAGSESGAEIVVDSAPQKGEPRPVALDPVQDGRAVRVDLESEAGAVTVVDGALQKGELRSVATDPVQDGRAVRIDLGILVEECTRVILERPRDGSPPMVALSADVVRAVAEYARTLSRGIVEAGAPDEALLWQKFAVAGPAVGGDGAADAWGSVVHSLHVSAVRRDAEEAPSWRRDPPPRGVRCLVTWTGPDGRSLPRVRVASVSPDHEDERWFSDGERLHHVVAWMPAPEAARDEALP